jgi:hypothetical protein
MDARLGAVLAVGAAVVHSQAPAAPAGYHAALLPCAAFDERIDTRIRSRRGSSTVRDRAGRVGVVVVRLTDSSGVAAVEAWYDSLAVWRDTEAGRESAETEGFLGGRYRGRLGSDGRYQSRARPFVPDDLASLVDLGGAMDDFLPRLPAEELEPGRTWRDTTGLVIRRLHDQGHGGQRVRRYHWSGDARSGRRVTADSLTLPVDQRVRETGELLWSSRWGPLSWQRTVVVDARVTAGEDGARALDTTVEQEVRVTRRSDHAACRPAGSEDAR